MGFGLDKERSSSCCVHGWEKIRFCSKKLRFCTKSPALLRFRTKFHYDFAPKNYDFAPNLPDQIIMISHQIYNDFAPNLLRFRTKFNMILHKLPSNFPLFWVRLGKSWAPSGRESFPQG